MIRVGVAMKIYCFVEFVEHVTEAFHVDLAMVAVHRLQNWVVFAVLVGNSYHFDSHHLVALERIPTEMHLRHWVVAFVVHLETHVGYYFDQMESYRN